MNREAAFYIFKAYARRGLVPQKRQLRCRSGSQSSLVREPLHAPLTLKLNQKPMARPPKKIAEKLTERVRVRVTATEKAALAEAAKEAGLTVSDFVRARAINAVPRLRKATPERAVFVRALANLTKMGSSLDHIAVSLGRMNERGELEGFSMGEVEHILNNIDTLSEVLLKLAEHGH